MWTNIVRDFTCERNSKCVHCLFSLSHFYSFMSRKVITYNFNHSRSIGKRSNSINTEPTIWAIHYMDCQIVRRRVYFLFVFYHLDAMWYLKEKDSNNDEKRKLQLKVCSY